MNPTAAAQISALLLPSDPAGLLPAARLLDPGATAGLLASIASIVDQFAPPGSGRAQFVSTKTADLTITGVSSTGFLAAMDLADGSTVIAADNDDLVLPDGVSPRTIEVWSCVSAVDDTQSGGLEELVADDCGIITCDVSRCETLSILHLHDNAEMTSIGDVTALTLLEELHLANCSALTSINAPGLALAVVDIESCAALNYVNLYDNALAEAEIDGLFTPLDPDLAGTIICDGGTNEAPSALSADKRDELELGGWVVTVTP
jgi:hypothetical protein